MPFNYTKLRGKIIGEYGSLGKFAEHKGISANTLSRKLNNKVNISNDEVVDWSNDLSINPADIGTFFYTLKV